MKNLSRKGITILMTCMLIIVSIIVIILKVNDANISDNRNSETATVQGKKMNLDTASVEKIWKDSGLEGNKKDNTYFRFEFPMYRGENAKEVFSLFFRFYVSCEDGENYLDSRIIFGGYYNIEGLSPNKEIGKTFSISSGDEKLKFNIFKDEEVKAQDGNSYSTMAFATEDISILEKMTDNKKISINISLDNKQYSYKLNKNERKNFKTLILNYSKLQKETNKQEV